MVVGFFSLLPLLAILAHGQCVINQPVDIVWVLDGSAAMQPDALVGAFDDMIGFVTSFTGLTQMGEESVRQGFVEYAGLVDPSLGIPNSTTIVSIVSSATLSDSAAISSSLFLQDVQILEPTIGSRDIASALNFVSTNIFDADTETGRPRLVVLIASGPQTDSFGAIVDSPVVEDAINRLQVDNGAQILFIQAGDPSLFPANYLQNAADFVVSSSFAGLQMNLIDSGVMCVIFETDSPTTPPIITHTPTASDSDGLCYPLQSQENTTVGRVCATVSSTSIRLEYTPLDSWSFQYTRTWIGSDPTTIPIGSTGLALTTQFPFQSDFVSVSLSDLVFGDDCHVYFVPQVTAAINTSGETALAASVDVYAGDVKVNGQSEALLFRAPLPACDGIQRTMSPSVPPPTNEFSFDFIFTSTFTDQQMQSFAQPMEQLKSVFTTDYATSTCFEMGSVWCGYTFPSRTCVNDVLILVSLASIDGAGGSLAQSGPCVSLLELERIRVGSIVFDSSDFDSILTDGRFDAVVVHHMMHVIGFGTRWDTWGLLSSSNYIGTNGVAGFRQVGGSVSGYPSLDATLMNWSEDVFETELMTPTIGTGSNPLSVMSLMSLIDMNFQVDVSKADYYRIPSSTRRLLTAMQRWLDSPQPIDTLSLPIQKSNWTVKPGRDDDLQQEIEFARLHLKTFAPTSSSSTPSTGTLVGIIIGSILGVCLLCLVVTLLYRHRRSQKKNRKEKIKKDVDEKRKSVPAIPDRKSNWSEKTDGEGRTFWINEDTGEFSWTPPEAFTRGPEREPSNATSQTTSSFRRAVQTPGGDKWSEMTDDTGAVYWINEESGEFSWVAPSGYSASKGSTQPLSSTNVSPIRRINSSSTRLPSESPQSPSLMVSIASPDSQLVAAQPPSPRYDEESNDEARVSLMASHAEDDRMSSMQAWQEQQDIEASPTRSYRDFNDDSHLTESLPHFSMRSRPFGQ